MTEERNFDRRVRAWLDEGPNQAPDRLPESVLSVVAMTPQVRARRLPRPVIRGRGTAWNRTGLVAVAALVAVVIVGSTLWLRQENRSVVGPATTPSPVPSAAPTPSGPIPTATASPSGAATSTPGPTPTTALAPTPVAPAIVATGDSVALATGDAHACAVSRAGAVSCWGTNAGGQLGDHSTTSRSAPVAVPDLSSGVIAITAGANHTCALTTAGGVECWGKNGFGQLGNGTTTDGPRPVAVKGLGSGVTAISAGGDHTCALTSAGGVKCWGAGISGELGNGASVDSNVPVDVVGLASGVVAIAAGSGHTLAVLANGAVKGWGCNCTGQVGNGSTADINVPADVTGLAAGVMAVSGGGAHSCAVTTAGGALCWGDGSTGKLGTGGFTQSTTPVALPALQSGVAAISAGGVHTCALLAGAGLKCWGDNTNGQLGDGTTKDHATPVDVAGLGGGVRLVSLGSHFSCALTTDGGVVCWGANSHGQLGDGSNVDSPVPVMVTGLTHDGAHPPPTASASAAMPSASPSAAGVSTLLNKVIAIGTGLDLSCALIKGGTVDCWGDNTGGALGTTVQLQACDEPALQGQVSCSKAPIEVEGLTEVAAISVGGNHVCALTASGGAKCWGLGVNGQLGNGTFTNSSTPVDVVGLTSGVKALSAGYLQTCALTQAGGVKCWGDNTYGGLGDGSSATSSNVPVDVAGLDSGVTAISTNGGGACALLAGGAVQCWGGGYSTLLTGSAGVSRRPVDIAGLGHGVMAVSVGGDHACAIMNGGTVKCWGDNVYGELGNGSTDSSPTPITVPGLSNVVALATSGVSTTCALTSSAAVKCWGNNGNGQVGDGTTTNRTSPVDVVGLSGGVVAIAAHGFQHTCALMQNGSVKCWGGNEAGELGDGTQIDRWKPVDVGGP